MNKRMIHRATSKSVNRTLILETIAEDFEESSGSVGSYVVRAKHLFFPNHEELELRCQALPKENRSCFDPNHSADGR